MQYRFSKGGVSSGLRNLIIVVKRGDQPPKLQLQPLAARSFEVGQSVVLDASQTWDDFPDTLLYRWEQIAGVPIHMEARNEEGSVVAFVIPSLFSREEDPHLVIRVSAVDQSGQRASKDVRINTISKRKGALWNGLAGGGAVRMELSTPEKGEFAKPPTRAALN